MLSLPERRLDRQRVEACVEALCHRGCKAVWGVIAALEQGGELAETRALNGAERAEVLAELKSIMAVYGGSCSLS